jgi:hypothetical protein
VSAVIATLEHCQNCCSVSDGVWLEAADAGAEETAGPDGALAGFAPGATAADEVAAAVEDGPPAGAVAVSGFVAGATGATVAVTVGVMAVTVWPAVGAVTVAGSAVGAVPDEADCGSVCASVWAVAARLSPRPQNTSFIAFMRYLTAPRLRRFHARLDSQRPCTQIRVSATTSRARCNLQDSRSANGGF